MSLSDGLRPPLLEMSKSYEPPRESVSSDRAVTGITLVCEDMSESGINRRDLEYSRDSYRNVDLVRATIARATSGVVDNARAIFSSPVMSRLHARISFEDDGCATVTDLASTHGTYFEKERGPLKMLEPYRPYYLRHGDVLLLGKSVLKDNRNWKPVRIRVKFSSPRQEDSVASNRYGVFNACTSDCSDLEDDSSVSSEAESHGEDNLSSPDTSPIPSIKSFEADQHGLSQCKLKLGPNESDDTTNLTDHRGTGITSTGARLRAMLPFVPPIQIPLQIPLPFSRFSTIHNLPSLRELGFSSSANNGKNDRVKVNHGEVNSPTANNIADADVTTRAPPTSAISIPSASNSNSNYQWAEPSLPQNQLGLEPSQDEFQGLYPKLTPDPHVYITSEAVKLAERFDEDEGEKSMEISPSPEPFPGPQVQPAVDCDVNEGDASNFSNDVHNQGEHAPRSDAFSNNSFTPLPHVTASRISQIPLEGSDTREGHVSKVTYTDYRRMTTNESTDYTKNPLSPLYHHLLSTDNVWCTPSIGADQHHFADPNLGNNVSSFGRREPHESGVKDSELEILRTSISKLDERMQELCQVSARAVSSDVASVSSNDRKEMDAVHEEMRRLSALVESVLTKMNDSSRGPSEDSVDLRPDSVSESNEQDESSEERKEVEEVTVEHENLVVTPEDIRSSPSRKRKRDTDVDVHNIVRKVIRTDISEFVDVESLEDESQESGSDCESKQYIVIVGGRPAKRARTESRTGHIVRSVAAAAGYTSLGAILTWTALAYAL